MTVGELIEFLRQFPDDMPVVERCKEGRRVWYHHFTGRDSRVVHLKEDATGDYGRSRSDAKDSIEALELYEISLLD